MALITWGPNRELHTIQQDMNRLFGSFFDTDTVRARGNVQRRWIPAMDLVEDGDHYVLRLDIPGVAQDDVKVELVENVLTISGERRSEHESAKDGNRRIERAWGSFTRSLTLPEGIDANSLTASYDKGVLQVSIPKPEVRRPQRVTINVGDAAPAIETPETPAS
jgi:HSP20 family protein